MRVYRLCRRKHAARSLDGRGGLLVAGRWHHEGHAVVYTSASPSLAALEYLVHVDSDLFPEDLVSVTIEIPAKVRIDTRLVKDLPRGWDAVPAGASSRDVGGKWLSEGRTAVLAVPSAVVPQEVNYLINPKHPDSGLCSIAATAKFTLDRRILRK